MLILRQSLVRLVTLLFLRKGNRLKWEADNLHPSRSEANNVSKLQQFALCRFSECCFSKTNLPLNIAVFKIMTADAPRTMQSVSLECWYVHSRLDKLQSILPITLVQSSEHLNGTTCFGFSLRVRLFSAPVYKVCVCVVNVCNKLGESLF